MVKATVPTTNTNRQKAQRSALATLCGPMCTTRLPILQPRGLALVTGLQGVPVLLLQARFGNPLPVPHPGQVNLLTLVQLPGPGKFHFAEKPPVDPLMLVRRRPT